MEKNVFRCLLILLVCFVTIFAGNVSAVEVVKGPIKDWGEDKAVTLCKYSPKNKGSEAVQIVYNILTNEYGVYYRNNGKWLAASKGNYKTAFHSVAYVIGSGDMDGSGAKEYPVVGIATSVDSKKISHFADEVKEDELRCPNGVYIREGSKSSGVIFAATTTGTIGILDSDDNNKDKYARRKISNKKAEDNKFTQVENYLNNLSEEDLKQIVSESADKNVSVLSELPKETIKNALVRKIKNDYFNGTLFDYHKTDTKIPKGIEYIINKFIEKDNNEKLWGMLDDTAQNLNDQGVLTDEALENFNQNAQTNWNNTVLDVSENPINQDTSYGSAIQDPTEDITCTSILTQDLTVLVKNLINFVRFLGPLMVIVLTIIDLVSSVLSADVSVRKPLGKFVRRLIAAAILFFLPFIIFPLFDFLHITMAEECFEILN